MASAWKKSHGGGGHAGGISQHETMAKAGEKYAEISRRRNNRLCRRNNENAAASAAWRKWRNRNEAIEAIINVSAWRRNQRRRRRRNLKMAAENAAKSALAKIEIMMAGGIIEA
jgi:hypothetical protein